MKEFLDVLVSPWNLLWALVIFGLAPGLVLRMLVKLYPKKDPRRAELVAELYTVPRLMRPMWVAEQLEVTIFEGLARRRAAARDARRGARGSNTLSTHNLRDEVIALRGLNRPRIEKLLTEAGVTGLQREVIILRVGYGYTAQQTAEVIGSTPGAVRVAQHRGLQRLRKFPGDLPGDG